MSNTEFIRTKLDAVAATSSDFNKSIRSLWLKLSPDKDSMYDMFHKFLSDVHVQLPNVPHSEIEAMIDAMDIPTLETQVIGMATDLFTQEEIDEVLVIFNNPTFLKFLADRASQENDFMVLTGNIHNMVEGHVNARLQSWADAGYM